MKLIVILIAITLLFATSLCGQARTIQGRVISEDLQPLYKVLIQSTDTTLLGETDLNGRFKIEVSQRLQTIFLNWIGFEPVSIKLKNSCDTLEIIMLYAATYDFMSPKKIDKQRLKRFNMLPALHLQAYDKGLFSKKIVCYSNEFKPEKSVLDSINENIVKQQRKNKKAFEAIEVGDTIKIPFGTEYDSDKMHKTTLIVYSFLAYKLKYDCIIEVVITSKNHRKKGYNLLCKVIGCNLCQPESTYHDRTMKIGEVFEHNMKYFKVLTE